MYNHHLYVKLNGVDYQLDQQSGTLDGTGSANRIPYWIDSNTLGDALYFSSQRLGIGNTQDATYALKITDPSGGSHIKLQRGTGVATFDQDNNASNLYINAAAGLLLNAADKSAFGSSVDATYKVLIKDASGGAALKIQRGTGVATFDQDNNTNNLYIGAAAQIIFNTAALKVTTIPSTDNTTTPLAIDGSGNFTKKTDVIDGSGTSTQIPYFTDGNTVTSEAALTYNSTTNNILITNAGSTATTTIFGGEIQLDNISGSDDVTITNNGIQISGVSDYDITNSSGTVSINGIGLVRTTTTFNFPNTAAGAASSTTFTLTGAADGDVCHITAPAAVEAGFGGCHVFRCYVSAADTITIEFDNCSSLSVDPGNGTYAVVLFKQ
jgi:hypothetical protein